MKSKALILLTASCLISLSSCSQTDGIIKENEGSQEQTETVKTEPHRYGGWYCPDNLNGFPAVDIANWNKVPVVNGRMPTKEDTKNGSSLILVDVEKYPNAKPLDITMPKLARFYNEFTERFELIIVIQAFNIDNDNIVGFRYLNGGNGSARLNEVTFLNENEIAQIPNSRFVSYDIKINATQDEISKILTNPDHAKALQPTFDKNKKLNADWRKTSNVNYRYPKSGKSTAAYADILFGAFYVQNDYDRLGYNEKFLLLEDKEANTTTLKIVCGPFIDDYDAQKSIITNWAKKVKELSEKG
ncbi:MAG: hypothetical protein R3A50_09895 [Saprospiraceae bacterium]